MNFTYKTVSQVGLIRDENEDSLGVYKMNDGLMAIVCDGLGGNKAGEVASHLAVDFISSHFENSADENYIGRIKTAVIQANTAINTKANSTSELNGMSTTVEVLFLKDDKAYLGHVGDSRIYSFSNDKLTQLTKDHSFVQRLIDEGLLSREEADEHPNKNIITRALGDSIPVEVDTEIIEVSSSDRLYFFLCTDGVCGVIDNNELQEIFMLNDFDNISRSLSNLIEERGAPDNYSFVLIKVD